MSAYYNEIDKGAAQWLRNLIAAGHIAPGDVDERSITEVQPDDLRGYMQCHFFAGIGGWSYAVRLAGWSDIRPSGATARLRQRDRPASSRCVRHGGGMSAGHAQALPRLPGNVARGHAARDAVDHGARLPVARGAADAVVTPMYRRVISDADNAAQAERNADRCAAAIAALGARWLLADPLDFTRGAE